MAWVMAETVVEAWVVAEQAVATETGGIVEVSVVVAEVVMR